ncbi:MAG: radical SAM protein, partial [Candidatus Omnitrophota bacterium]
MCYQRTYNPAGNMPAGIYNKYLLPLYPYLRRIIVHGGEPTIMPNCRELMQVLDQYPDIRFEFSTNGICVDEFWMGVFMERADSIKFSINAATPNTYDRIMKYGDFNKVLGNVRRITKVKINKKPAVLISTVLLRHNANEIAEFIDLGYELGVDNVKFSVDPVLSFYKLTAKDVRRELDKALRVIERTGMAVKGLNVIARYVNYPWSEGDVERRVERCLSPFTKLIVDRSGDVRVCCYTWRVLGNIHKSSLKEVLENWQRKRLQQMTASGDHSWCAPYCPNNPAPRKMAQFNRYFYLLRRNPGEFLTDIIHRLGIRRYL